MLLLSNLIAVGDKQLRYHEYEQLMWVGQLKWYCSAGAVERRICGANQ